VSPFSIVKLQDSSVVALEFSESCALVLEDIASPGTRSAMSMANLPQCEIIVVES
jgi:hypothetical protein